MSQSTENLDDRPWEQPGYVRRDCEPHRGSFLAILGWASFVGGFLFFLIFPGLIGFPLGLATWILATKDLKKMEMGLLDPRGELQTRDARRCATFGIVFGFISWMILGIIMFYDVGDSHH